MVFFFQKNISWWEIYFIPKQYYNSINNNRILRFHMESQNYGKRLITYMRPNLFRVISSYHPED